MVTRSRVASVFVALALVLAAVGGGLGPMSATQTAEASILEEDCTLSDALTGPLTIAYNTVMGLDNRCQYDTGANTDYENVTATDAYATSLGIKDSSESYTTSVANFQQDTRAVAYSKGKIEMVRSLENGTSESQAKFAANQSVRDYYAKQDTNLLADWNAKVTQIRYLNQSAGLDVRMGDRVQGFDDSDPFGSIYWYGRADYETVNGTTTTVKFVIYENTAGTGDKIGTPVNATQLTNHQRYNETAGEWQNYTGTTDWFDVSENWDSGDVTFAAKDPETGNYSATLNASKYRPIHEETLTQSDQVTANLNPYVTEVYNQYQTGDLNATDIVQNDPTLLAEQASTNYNSTGYYGYAAAQLAAIGAAGDVNASHVISVDGGSNFTGTLFYTGEDRTNFTTGETYQFSDLNGTVYLAASDGPNNASGIVNLNQKGSSFTIESATNTNTNESVQNTTVQKFVYETTDASALQSEIDRLEALRDYYEEQATNDGTGINLGTDDKAIIGLIAAVVLVLALRD